MHCYQVFGVAIIIILNVITVGLLVATSVSYDWFLSNEDTSNINVSKERLGLWKSCKTKNGWTSCVTSKDILKFNMNRQGIIVELSFIKE